MKKIIFIICLLLSAQVYAQEPKGQITIEAGRAKSLDNNFSIPNSAANEINLPDGQNLDSYRIYGRVNLKNDKFLYFLYAPFETSYNIRSGAAFKFDNTNFSGDKNTKIDYKFNSYRLGYFKQFFAKDNFKYWIGGVLKVRDAEIKVSQDGVSNSYANVGVVPLLGLGFEYFIRKDISLFSHIDAAGFGQGYAYDFNVETKYHLDSKNAMGVGYRTFGGGVDNDKVMNFARFEILYLNYSVGF